MLLNTLKDLGLKILMALLTETVMKKLIMLLLRKLAERTDNKIDDEVVKIVEEALEKEPK